MSYSDLHLDVHSDIYSYLSNKDLNPILRSSKKTGQIAYRYLQPQINNNKAIKISALNGDVDAVRSLFRDPRVDPSHCDNYATRVALENGHLGVVKLLLSDSRVNPSSGNNFAIRKHPKMVMCGSLSSYS